MKTIRLISHIFTAISMSILVVMMLISVADIILRYFFNMPIKGAIEIVEFMMVVVVFPSLAWAALEKQHVKVDLLVSHFSPKTKVIINSITMILTLVTFLIITWRCIIESLNSTLNTVMKSSLIGLPYYPIKWIMTAGFVMFSLAIIGLTIETVGEMIQEVRK